MSRTRLIRPAFFTDERMAALSFGEQVVYIGLWTLCDDAGYFERRPVEIAAELFRFKTARRRQRIVDEALETLVRTERVRWLDCGEHGVVPTLPEHGVMRGGNHAYNVKAKHDEACALTLFRARQAPMTREYVPGTNKSVSGSVSDSGTDSVSGLESGRGAPRGLQEAATEAGGFVAALAGRKP
jgi:hypothetical protein